MGERIGSIIKLAHTLFMFEITNVTLSLLAAMSFGCREPLQID